MEDKKKAEEMKIDEDLKNNLIADVENICEIKLNGDTKESLKRCFEITIGTHYLTKSSEALPSDEEIREWAKDVEIEGRDEEKMSGFDYMVFAAKTMRDMIRNRLQEGKS